MQIFHIASELAPVAKVGGLADVVYGLSRELVAQGHTVSILLPKYDCLDTLPLNGLRIIEPKLECAFDNSTVKCSVWAGQLGTLQLYLIESPFFNRGVFYGQKDDVARFTFFCKAALDFLLKKGLAPDILHLHDWQASAAIALLEESYRSAGLRVGATVLTLHSVEHQGWCQESDLKRIGLVRTLPALRHGVEGYNLLKGGILLADGVTSVSPTYVKEIQTPLGGRGLDQVFREVSGKLSGILNGIDSKYWNPSTDPLLPFHYSPLEGINCLQAKGRIKSYVRQKFSLSERPCPLVASITRIVPEKAPELIRFALLHTLERDGQFALLGSSPIPELQAEFAVLSEAHRNSRNLHCELSYNERLSHLVFAAADMLIMPSLSEPCGLTQMIALKYGAIPIVRRTGGLKDTVFDIDDTTVDVKRRNGFCFNDPDETGMRWALDRALDLWHKERPRWDRLALHGMQQDFSWRQPCRLYLQVYERVLGVRRQI